MRRAAVSLTVFACLLATAACGDSTAPKPDRPDKAPPNGASNTRYILASGEAPPTGCRDLGNGYWLCDDGGEMTQTAPAVPIAPPPPVISGDSVNSDSGN